MINTGFNPRTYRELIYAWTYRTVQARYQQSLLGVLWAIAQPVAQVAIYSFIFTIIVQVDTGGIPYPIFNFAAMAPWLFFSASLTDMVGSLVVNMNLVKKIYFPREILPIAAMLARLLDFGIGLLIIFALMLFYDLPIFPSQLLMLPVIILIQIVLMAGLGLIGSALNVFYRDIQHVFTLLIRIWMYACPVVYPIAQIPERYQRIYFLNPMSGIIEGYRAVILYGEFPDHTGYSLSVAAAVSGVIFIIGWAVFKFAEPKFADIV